MALAAAPEVPGFRAPSPVVHGPTSSIYSAQSLNLGRWVALTVYSLTLRDEQAQRRFRRGFEVCRRLGAHPHAMTVLELGLTPEGRPFVVTELYDYGTVDNLTQQGQPCSVGEVLRMGVSLAGALETAHRSGVIHGGIHPARVLLDETREPALADLGLVPLVDRAGLAALVGPMTYHAPPEVLEGDAPTPETDVYSLASTLYTALTGRAPFAPSGSFGSPQRLDEDTSASLLLRILQHDIPAIERRDVPPSLEKLLDQALSSEPRHRPARPLALAQALQGCQVEMGLAPSQPVVLDIPATLNLVAPAPAATAPAPAPAPPAAPTFDDLPAARATPVAPSPAPERVFVPYSPPEPEPEPPSEPQLAAVAAAAPASAPAAPVEHQAMAPRFDPVLAPPGPAPAPGPVAPAIGPDIDDHVLRPELEITPEPEPEAEEQPAASVQAKALPVIVLAVLVAVIFAGVTWSIVTGDSADNERADSDDPSSTSSTGNERLTAARSGLTAVESSVGVQLDWDGRSADPQVVVIFSTTQPPRTADADAGSALLIPTGDLDPNAGYCFAVVATAVPTPPVTELADEVAPEDLPADSCIRSASAGTVLRGP